MMHGTINIKYKYILLVSVHTVNIVVSGKVNAERPKGILPAALWS